MRSTLREKLSCQTNTKTAREQDALLGEVLGAKISGVRLADGGCFGQRLFARLLDHLLELLSLLRVGNLQIGANEISNTRTTSVHLQDGIVAK